MDLHREFGRVLLSPGVLLSLGVLPPFGAAVALDRGGDAFHMPPMSLIHNERTKLMANALDRASTACLTVGALGPAVASLYGLGAAGAAAASHGVLIALGSLFWLAAAGVLHFMARSVLGRLI